MGNNLTIEMVEEMIKSLPPQPKELIFKKLALLRTTQVAIKQGNEIFYPDDIKYDDEIKVIEIPEFFDCPKFEPSFYFDEPLYNLFTVSTISPIQ